jgi:hypothetical protein
MKAPDYMKITMDKKSSDNGCINYTVTIKRKDVPRLIREVLKERYSIKWYHWLLYPYICLKIMCRCEA